MKIENFVRKNILKLKPYTAARHSQKSGILLDANENSFGSVVKFKDVKLNRYPDPYQRKLREGISKLISIPKNNIFFGVGSDEIIDLLVRIFCEPKTDNVVIPEPTYGMYRVVCDINNIKVRTSTLTDEFQLDLKDIYRKINKNTKAIFLCSPNNPTGNVLNKNDIFELCKKLNPLVIVDEAYIDFAEKYSLVKYVKKYPNLIVLRTFSKAWGLAGLRCGYCIANEEVVKFLMRVKTPYSISGVTEKIILDAIDNVEKKNNFVERIKKEKDKLFEELIKLKNNIKIYPSDANFILFKCNNAIKIFTYLAENGIIIRDRSNQINLENCLRVSVGTPTENKLFLKYIKNI